MPGGAPEDTISQHRQSLNVPHQIMTLGYLVVGHALEEELLMALPQAVLQEAGPSQVAMHRVVELQEEVHVLGVTQAAPPWADLFPLELRVAGLFLEVLQAVDLVLVVLRVVVHVLEGILLSSNTANSVRSNASKEARQEPVIVTWRWTCRCWPSWGADTRWRRSRLRVPTRKSSGGLTWRRASGWSSRWSSRRWPSSRHNCYLVIRRRDIQAARNPYGGAPLMVSGLGFSTTQRSLCHSSQTRRRYRIAPARRLGTGDQRSMIQYEPAAIRSRCSLNSRGTNALIGLKRRAGSPFLAPAVT